MKNKAGAVVIALLLASCAATGYVSKGDVSAPRTVTIQKDIDPEVAPYVPKFVAILAAAGLKVGPSDDKHALELRFDFNGNPFNLRVGASLWQDGVPVLTASATNSGWGTALARGAAVQNLADSAAATFEKELSELRPRVRVVDTP